MADSIRGEDVLCYTVSCILVIFLNSHMHGAGSDILNSSTVYLIWLYIHFMVAITEPPWCDS